MVRSKARGTKECSRQAHAIARSSRKQVPATDVGTSAKANGEHRVLPAVVKPV